MTYRPVEDAMDVLAEFVQVREWQKFHTPRNLATSIAVEAGELLECVQWGEEPDREAMAWELADVLCYAFHLAKELDVDPVDLVVSKISQAERKYPAGHQASSGQRTMDKIARKEGL